MTYLYVTLAFLGMAAIAILIWTLRQEARLAGETKAQLRQAQDAIRKTRTEAEILARPARSKPDVLAILRDHAE